MFEVIILCALALAFAVTVVAEHYYNQWRENKDRKNPNQDPNQDFMHD